MSVFIFNQTSFISYILLISQSSKSYRFNLYAVLLWGLADDSSCLISFIVGTSVILVRWRCSQRLNAVIASVSVSFIYFICLVFYPCCSGLVDFFLVEEAVSYSHLHSCISLFLSVWYGFWSCCFFCIIFDFPVFTRTKIPRGSYFWSFLLLCFGSFLPLFSPSHIG
jgi:hypothetical protein